jgi:two-component system, OmpR family, response regulator
MTMRPGTSAGVCEDDDELRGVLRHALEREGFDVRATASGTEAVRAFAAAPPDVLVLDIGLPDADGRDVCQALRSRGVRSPVLFLTARDAVTDRISGFHAGGDDYLTKPFSLAELTARLRALVRRGPTERPAVLEVGELRLDPSTREVWRGDAEIHLSTREFALLETFMRRPGHVLTQMQLLEAAWDLGYEQRSNVVEVYVRYLRQKIDRPFGVSSIETVRGAGYRLRRDGGR